jgi:curved DNA-binding protein CbpA
MVDYYAILELGKDAAPDEIKTNYRRLAMRWHPDRNKDSAEAEERFKAISEAYSVLSDPASKAAYDEALRTGQSGRMEQRAESPAAYGPFVFVFSGGFDGSGRGYGWASGFSKERASDIFMEEMYNLAIELTLQNVPWRDIAEELMQRGCPESAALAIARRMERQRKTMVRNRARPYFLRSALSGIIGLTLLTVFWGFGLLGFAGLIMSLNGAYNLVRAVYFLTTGAAPRTGIL